MDNNENKNVCPCCGKHCDLSAPGCERGEEYARTGVIPERKGYGKHDHHGECGGHGHHNGHGEHGGYGEGERGHHEGCGEHGHHGGHGCRSGHDRHERHKEHRSILESERYEAMDTDSKLMAMIRELRHLGRFGFDSKGGQGRIVRMLSEDGSMTQRELTERLGIQPGSASEVIGKLERAGQIVRTQSKTDRRTMDIALTEAGRAKAEQLALERDARVHEMFSVLTPEEKTSFLATLEKLNRDWLARGRQC